VWLQRYSSAFDHAREVNDHAILNGPSDAMSGHTPPVNGRVSDKESHMSYFASAVGAPCAPARLLMATALCAAVCILAIFVFPHAARAGEIALPGIAALKTTCASLPGKTIAGVTVTAAVRFEAVANVAPAGLCRVSGTRAPFLDIEVDVPDDWSGRLFQVGGGGFDGSIFSGETDSAGVITGVNPVIAVQGAVYAASNGGNRASVPAQAAPGVWASGTADGRASSTDYAYQSVGTTVHFAEGVIQAFFATPAKFRYFSGCSNGGREAYIAAERWPNDYDGIVSGCETEDMAGLVTAWLNIASRGATPAALSGPQYHAAYTSAVAACDAQDGLVDGYLTNAAGCRYDPGLLLCGLPTANADPKLCLTALQVQTLKNLMSPLKLADGTVIYAGFPWADFSSSMGAFGGLASVNAFLATDDPSWMTPAKQATFNVDVDYPLIRSGLVKAGMDHNKPAIAAFVASGKKIISWHANGDPLLSSKDHARNDALLTKLIKSRGVTDPATGTRFFLVPANSHGLGAIPGQIDWAGAIIDWVEKGIAPSQLTFTFSTSMPFSSPAPAGGADTRQLPVCLFPKAPRYNGVGDTKVAGSYTCT
jgi:hypothetical protein